MAKVFGESRNDAGQPLIREGDVRREQRFTQTVIEESDCPICLPEEGRRESGPACRRTIGGARVMDDREQWPEAKNYKIGDKVQWSNESLPVYRKWWQFWKPKIVGWTQSHKIAAVKALASRDIYHDQSAAIDRDAEIHQRIIDLYSSDVGDAYYHWKLQAAPKPGTDSDLS